MRTRRLAAGLTQFELGLLLGVSEDMIGSYELGVSEPRPAVLLGCMYLFGKPPADLFPRLHREVLEQLERGAVACDERWRHRTDPKSLKKLAFLRTLSSALPDKL
jgi:transcriptional regulator with XRE-family HTH domain